MLPAAKRAFEQLVVRYPDLPTSITRSGGFSSARSPTAACRNWRKKCRSRRAIRWPCLRSHSNTSSGPITRPRRRGQRRLSLPIPGLRCAQGARAGAARKGRHRRRDSRARGRRQDGADSPVMHFQLAKAYQKAGRDDRRGARTCGVHQAGSRRAGGARGPAVIRRREDTGASTQPFPNHRIDADEPQTMRHTAIILGVHFFRGRPHRRRPAAANAACTSLRADHRQRDPGGRRRARPQGRSGERPDRRRLRDL